MSIYTDEIDKIYRLAKKFNKERIQNFSQVGEKYDPKKFRFEQAHTAHIDAKSKGGSHEQRFRQTQVDPTVFDDEVGQHFQSTPKHDAEMAPRTAD